ncbi:MAG: hypothetical protein SangKO_059620 [Sandaracinaceae bacterium]
MLAAPEGGSVTPAEANQIALRAVRQVIQAAEAFQLTVAGREVRVEVERQDDPWPMPVAGLSEETDGPWPQQVVLRCNWDGGAVDLLLFAGAARRPEAKVAIAIRVLSPPRQLTWCNVATALDGSEDPEIAISAWYHLKKRVVGSRGSQSRKNKKLKALVGESGLPLLTDYSVEPFIVRTEDAAVLPSPVEAYRRLVHLSLIKLDFFVGGEAARARGVPIIDLAALGLADEDDDELVDAEDEADGRKYWAGGFGEEERRVAFLKDDYWQIGWKRDDEGKGAAHSWARFEDVQVGDWFAIKGLGGSYQLVVHYVGEVTGKDDELGRLDLRPLDSKLYKGPAPRGSGAGSWFETLVPVTREDIIELIFGESRETEPALTWTGPRNVILYGPPGTGKTYRLRDDIRPKFTRASEARAVDVDALLALSWFEVIAAAVAASGGSATAMELRQHPLVKTKYQAKDHKAPIGSRIWATLQAHTVESSRTVGYSKRTGRLVFDKREDGTWFFPGGVPEDIAELAETLRPRAAEATEDFVFLTFHQSYAYEDFIEGIRPKTSEGEGDGSATLTYDLEDGVFLRAANAAVRLAGFEGTVDELCRLPAQERADLLDGAPPYAVFIDEVNRGNVSRIFGELITLLEEDKRLGAEGELIVTLPYSRRRFGVPSNLCVIGTMNTADRSVEALDSALRRRFSFIECPPDPSVLDGTVVEGGVDVVRMLRVINARLELLIDRDHLLGHAYFMAVQQEPTIEKLKEVFAMNILPLLSEYFYADLGRVGLVLGAPFVREAGSYATLAAFNHEAADQLSERRTYRLTPLDSISTADFRAIYETAGG